MDCEKKDMTEYNNIRQQRMTTTTEQWYVRLFIIDNFSNMLYQSS